MSIVLVAVICLGLGGDVCRIDYIPSDAATVKACDATSQTLLAKELKLENGERIYSYSCQQDAE